MRLFLTVNRDFVQVKIANRTKIAGLLRRYSQFKFINFALNQVW